MSRRRPRVLAGLLLLAATLARAEEQPQVYTLLVRAGALAQAGLTPPPKFRPAPSVELAVSRTVTPWLEAMHASR